MVKLVADILKLPHVRCSAHVIDLFIKNVLSHLGLDELISSWRVVVGQRSALRSKMTLAGLNPRALNTPAHRWASALEFLREMSNVERLNKYVAFARTLKSEGDHLSYILEQSKKPHTMFAIAAALNVIEPAAALILTSESNYPSIHYADQVEVWTSHYNDVYMDSKNRTEMLVRQLGLEDVVSDDDVDEWEKEWAYAIEKGDDRISNHLRVLAKEAPRSAGQTAPASATDLVLTPLLRMRGKWDPAQVREKRVSFTYEESAWLKRNRLLAPNAIVSSFPAAVAVFQANLDTKYFLHAADPFAFWREIHRTGTIVQQEVADTALRCLSTPVSTAAAERSFSVLSNMEQDNKLLGKDEYVEAKVLIRYNKALYDKMFKRMLEPKPAEGSSKGTKRKAAEAGDGKVSDSSRVGLRQRLEDDDEGARSAPGAARDDDAVAAAGGMMDLDLDLDEDED